MHPPEAIDMKTSDDLYVIQIIVIVIICVIIIHNIFNLYTRIS